MANITTGTVTTSTALTALLTQLNITAARLKQYGGPPTADGSTMSPDHLAQTLYALARYVQSSEWRLS